MYDMTTQPAGEYEPRITFGDRLRRIRRDQRLTQPKFAQLLGQEVKAYSAWEAGTNKIPGDKMLEIATAVGELYGFTARDWLLGLQAPPPGPGPAPTDLGTERQRRLDALAETKRARGAYTQRYAGAA